MVESITPLIKQMVRDILAESLGAAAATTTTPPHAAASPSTPWGCPPNYHGGPPTFDHLHMAIYADKVMNPEVYTNKKTIAVIERLVEDTNDQEADKRCMQKKVQDVVDSENFPNELDKTFTVKRHGNVYRSNGNPEHAHRRPVKVSFNTPESSAAFIRAFRLVHSPVTKELSPFARRDMSFPELTLQNAMKKWTYESNKNGASTDKYTYRNLSIFQNRKK